MRSLHGRQIDTMPNPAPTFAPLPHASAFSRRVVIRVVQLVAALVLTTVLPIAAHANPQQLRKARILLYDGYGTKTNVIVRGRVIENAAPVSGKSGGAIGNAVSNLRRLETDEVKFAPVELSLSDALFSYRTDVDGIFTAPLDLKSRPLPLGALPYHALLNPPDTHVADRAEGIVHVLRDDPIIVISDIDDTIINSHVANKPRLLVNSFLKNASQITPVPKAAEAYRRADKAGVDLFMYVSGSPMALWDRLREYMSTKRLPRGPLFLKNLGDDPLFSQLEYKVTRITKLMSMFPRGRFILIGDSGEKDPEIYAAVKKQRPAQVAQIIIRRAPGTTVPKSRVVGMTLIEDYTAQESLLADMAQQLVKARTRKPAPKPPDASARH